MKPTGSPHERKSPDLGHSLLSTIFGPLLHLRDLLFCLALISPCFDGNAIASNGTSAFDLSALLKETAPLTQTITTDHEAIMVFSSFLEKNGLGIKNVRGKPSRKTPAHAIPDELTHLGIQLIGDIAISHWASNFHNILEKDPLDLARSSYAKQQDFIYWIRSKSSQPDLNSVLSLTTALLELSRHSRLSMESWDGYHDFVEQMLVVFPDWTGTDSAWVSVAEQAGASGILQRLESYWTAGSFSNALPSSQTPGNKEAYIGRFLQQLFIPISKAHLKNSLVGLKTQSERSAWELWKQVQAWKTRQDERQGLLRLCGTWQWLIHNHQNHGDHKTVMVYPPPSQYDRMDPKPAKVQVQGDTVYIRWEFPNGIIQEESLLLTEKDRMLSGNFVNNMGPNGNITGRRIAACKGP